MGNIAGPGESPETPGERARNPGDEANPGTPQTGEAPCPVCKGSGREGGQACANCGGTGVIVQNVGDA